MIDEFPFALPEPQRIDEILCDNRTLETETDIHYLIDPYDLIAFCFPVFRSDRENRPLGESLNMMVALYDVLYGHSQNPILLDEYVYELTEMVSWLKRNAEGGEDLLKRLSFSQLALNSDDEQDSNIDIGRSFTVVLAATLGLFSEGFSRLDDISRTRLGRRFLVEPDYEVLRKIFDENRGSRLTLELAPKLYSRLVDDYEERHRRPMSLYVKAKIRRSSIVDSRAVDRLLMINRAAAEALRAGKLERRHLFLFVSSAPRSRLLFALEPVRELFPEINGDPLCLLRTADQLLIQMICRADSQDETEQNIATLRRISQIRQRSLKVEPTLSSGMKAYLAGSLLPYREKIAQHLERVKNFGLASIFAKADNYQRLAQEADNGADAQRAQAIIHALMSQPDYPQIANESRNINLFFTKIKESFTNALLYGLARLKTSPEPLRDKVRTGRDPVGSSTQHLPTVFRLRFETFKDIIDDIVFYFRTPIHGRQGAARVIGEACTAFLERDTKTDSLRAEHEFIRCLLFLALPTDDADAFAYDHAIEMVGRLSELGSTAEDPMKRQRTAEFEREFRYLACWAARRQGFYRMGNEWAAKSIQQYECEPDPRFFHARCLNTFAWFDDYHHGYARKPIADISIQLAVDDAYRAIGLYGEWGADARDQVAALYNTLACLYVYKLDKLYDVKAARQCINKLKEASEKSGWYNRYPEYFHSEALVEYNEFCAMREDEVIDDHRKLDKLLHARREIDVSLDMYNRNANAELKNRDLVVLLKNQIELAIDEVGARG